MRTRASDAADELRAEYDFAVMKGSVRGKYARQYQEGTNLVLLAPDVAAVFRDTASVNDALRSLIGIARAQVPPRKSRANTRFARFEADSG
jgi:hypothetical protein